MKKCHSARDVTSVQSQALLETIKEADLNEKRRQKMLMKAPNVKRVEQLKSRFERERARDQEKISHLVSDLEQISAAASAGHIDMSSRQSGQPPSLPGKDKDRFAMSQYHTVYQRQYDKMVSQAQYAEWQNRDRYDEYAEKRRLMLLENKRDILQKLVVVQRNALTESHLAKVGPRPLERLPRAQSGRSWSDTSSVASSRSRSSRSEASYATFGTPADQPQKPSRLSKINVPKLSI